MTASNSDIWKTIAVLVSVVLLVVGIALPATGFKETTNRALDDHGRRISALEQEINKNYQEIIDRLDKHK